MAEQLKSPLPQSHASTLREDGLRRLSRSPHPYQKQKSELPYASERFSLAGPPNRTLLSAGVNHDEERDRQTTVSEWYRESTNSDSGTEADDEHFLKGLPAPRLRPPKGLRGVDGSLSGTSTPVFSPAIGDDLVYGRLGSALKRTLSPEVLSEKDVRKAVETFRHNQRIEIVRRVTESSILGFVGVILCLNPEVRELVSVWKRGMALPTSLRGRADHFRIILPDAHRSFPCCSIPFAVVTPHKSATALESTTSFGNSGLLRSCSSAVPTYDHHIRLYLTLFTQYRWASTRHNIVYVLPSQGPNTVSWRARRIQYSSLGALFRSSVLVRLYQKFQS
jgi:hypothetical protein